MQRAVWLALGYNVPINPSKIRVYVWRKLKEAGAEYFKQGMAILPSTAQNMQQFTTLAQKIRQMGGEASIVELRFTDPADETQMTSRFKKQIEEEYAQLLTDCANALHQLRLPNELLSAKDSDKLRQMVKRYRRARSHDYFKTGRAGEIEAGLNEIIDSVHEIAADVGKQLHNLMEG